MLPLRRTFRSILFATLTLVCAGAIAAPPPREAPRITLSDQTITIEVGDGSSVVIFGAAQDAGGTLRLMRWHHAATDDDNDGVIALPLPQDAGTNSLWIAVDATTGAIGTAAPPASEFRQVEFPGTGLPQNAGGAFDRYISGRAAVDLLLVRPHVGAWVGYAADGHDSDGDGAQNGRITLKFANLRRLRGTVSPPPGTLTPNDVLVAVDVRRREYYTTEVNP